MYSILIVIIVQWWWGGVYWHWYKSAITPLKSMELHQCKTGVNETWIGTFNFSYYSCSLPTRRISHRPFLLFSRASHSSSLNEFLGNGLYGFQFQERGSLGDLEPEDLGETEVWGPWELGKIENMFALKTLRPMHKVFNDIDILMHWCK